MSKCTVNKIFEKGFFFIVDILLITINYYQIKPQDDTRGHHKTNSKNYTVLICFSMFLLS